MADGRRRRPGANLTLLAAAGRHLAPVMVPAVAIAGTVGAWRALTPGMAGWAFAGDALLDSVRGSGPVAAGLTAWLLIASERSGAGRLERLGHRSAAAGPLTRVGVAAAAALAGYALTAGAVAAWLGGHGTIPGSLPAQEVAAGAAALLVHVTAGFLVALAYCALRAAARERPRAPLPRQPLAGLRLACLRLACLRLSRARLPRPPPRGACLARLRLPGAAGAAGVPAAVLAATWGLDACSDARWGAGWGTNWHGGAGWPALLLSPDVHHSPFMQWRPGLFLAALAWFCGLTAAAVLAAGWALTRRHRYAIAFAAAAVAAWLGLGQLHAAAAHPMTAAFAPVVCRTWPLDVCVNPAFAPALPQLELAFTAVAAQVSGTRAAIRSVTQLPPGATAPPRPGGYGFHLDDLGHGYALRAESDLTRQVAATLNHRPVTADIGRRARSAGSRAMLPVCRRYVPYAVEGGLELADMCTQGTRHLRPGRAQPP